MQVNELFRQSNTILLDGGMGTMLQAAGLKLGARPEELNITDPALIEGIHGQYAAAGSRIVNANTFGASAHKLAGSAYTLEQVITAGIENCKRACAPYGALTALDVGPLGELLEPSGTLAFEDAVSEYARIVRAGAAAGADLIFFETFTDLYELKAALLAAKENSTLPILASMSFEAGGRTFTGCTVESFAATARGLGADAVGINCSLGPKEILPIAESMMEWTNLPMIIKPNAGLPDPRTGKYDITAVEFAEEMVPFLEKGVGIVGGCCGTNTDFIRALSHKSSHYNPAGRIPKSRNGVCSAGSVAEYGKLNIIGERINPTGKKKLQQALRDGDMDYIKKLAVEQYESGAQILDVNVGLPDIDEPETMRRVVTAISGAVSLPLQIDSSSPKAIEAGLRAAPGKCMVNSVNASRTSLEAVLPITKKYGAAVVGLALGENGLPTTCEARMGFARTILNAALEAGIARENVAIDCLTLTVSAQQDQVKQTLEAVARVRGELGLETVLGVSNISFGLPQRTLVTQAFLTQAIQSGLTLPIINPNQKEMMDAVDACRVLSGEDAHCAAYIERHAAQTKPQAKQKPGVKLSIADAIAKGLCDEAAAAARELLETMPPLDVVEKELIPALDAVGEQYEKQIIFLPQLMNAAAASGAAFDEVRRVIGQSSAAGEGKGPIVLATVEGDIHDIGKNIVRTVLENYGFRVVDLGRDVPAERVVEAVRQYGAKIVGLSALMTTTVPSMERTIARLHENGLHVPVIVGGAVLTPDYAKKIGADYYAKDAKQSADIAKSILG